MSTSSLDLDNFNEPDRQLGKGHGIEALGPSDTSDTGSDLVGAHGWVSEAARKANEEIAVELGIDDSAWSSDTDSTGTGERSAAGTDEPSLIGKDIAVDRIERFPARKKKIDANDDV